MFSITLLQSSVLNSCQYLQASYNVFIPTKHNVSKLNGEKV